LKTLYYKKEQRRQHSVGPDLVHIWIGFHTEPDVGRIWAKYVPI